MSGRRGVAIVEFAVGSGVLFAMFAGTFEIGYTILQYQRLQAAIVAGAQYASITAYDSGSTTPSTAFTTAVRNMVLYGNPAGGTTPVVAGLQAQNVSLTVAFVNGVPSTMTVAIAGYSIEALFGAFPLSGKPAAAYPYMGIWAPA